MPYSRSILALALLPFLVGFVPPDSSGTYVSFAAGGGQRMVRSACSAPEVSLYRDYQASVYHQAAIPGHPGLKVGAGAQADGLASRHKACTTHDCIGGDSAWHRDGFLWTAGPFLTFDSRWFGASIGGYYLFGGEPENNPISIQFQTDLHTRGTVRVGPRDAFYAAIEVSHGSPMLSGAGPFNLGIGGRIRGTDLWSGISAGGPAARIGRAFGPVRVQVGGSYVIDRDEQTERNPSTGEDITVRYSFPSWSLSGRLEFRVD